MSNIKERKTILIFGISSYIGSNLANYLKDHFRIVGTYLNCRVNIPGVLTLPCDVLNRDQVQMIILTFKPQMTIYCVGLKSIELCSKFPKLADALNTVGLFNVTDYGERYGAKTCLISSGMVFGGENKVFLESETPDPNTVFGKTKTAAEFFIQKNCLNYLVFRCSSFYGRSYNPRQKSMLESMELKFAQEKSFTMDDKVEEGFLDTDYLAIIIKLCFERDVTNRMFQLSSKDVVTRYQFGEMYCEIFHKSKSLISKGSWPFFQMEGKKSSRNGLKYQMDVFNLESFLGIELPTVEESLKFTYLKWGGGDKKGVFKKQSGSTPFI